MKCARFTKAQADRLWRSFARVRTPKYTPSALLRGMNVEREHADLVGCSPTKAAKIAAAHLRERPDYYAVLEKYVEPKKRRA